MNTRRGRIVEQLGDLADLHRRIFEHLPGDLEAALINELLEANAKGVEVTIQRAAVHSE